MDKARVDSKFTVSYFNGLSQDEHLVTPIYFEELPSCSLCRIKSFGI